MVKSCLVEGPLSRNQRSPLKALVLLTTSLTRDISCWVLADEVKTHSGSRTVLLESHRGGPLAINRHCLDKLAAERELQKASVFH